METLAGKYERTDISDIFFQQFSASAQLIVASPGRINLIGEHTDYNEGFVLPAAIDKSIKIAISKRNDRNILLYSVDKEETYTTSLDALQQSGLLWPDYISGIVAELKNARYTLHGFSAVITGDIPIGAGLSSSAALECATIFALNELFRLNIDKMTMVKMARQSENNFIGLQCGIMDMFASMMGKEGHVIKLDCRSLEYEYFPLTLNGYKIVLLDSQVKHTLASSEYNTRRIECHKGITAIQKKHPAITSLRDATTEMIEETITDPVIKKRCLYVVQENERLINGCKDLQQGNLSAFGEKMYATHQGLQNMYEVSCTELDFLAAECRNEEAIIGARMMGGGFGGCIISIMKEEMIGSVTSRIAGEYHKKMSRELKVYVTQINNGTHLIA